MGTRSDGSFGKFYGHPDGEEKSKELIIRILKEFRIDMDFFKVLLLSFEINPSEKVTSLQDPLYIKFIDAGWKAQVIYPESDYIADYAKRIDNRYIFVEVELSDIRRNVNAFYMSRVFRTGYMRLGIYIIPESSTPETKKFFSRLTKMYDYLAPNYPLWVIGFEYP